MQTTNIGGVEIQFEAYPTLGKAVEDELKKLEPRHQKVAEEERCVPGSILRPGCGGIEFPPGFRFGSWDERPSEFPCVMEDAGLNGLMFSRSGHDVYSITALASSRKSRL